MAECCWWTVCCLCTACDLSGPNGWLNLAKGRIHTMRALLSKQTASTMHGPAHEPLAYHFSAVDKRGCSSPQDQGSCKPSAFRV